MKKLILSALVPIIALGIPSIAQAKTSVEAEAAIKTHCQDIKTVLDRIHRGDATMRVNRGQFYESLLNNFLKNFNDRLAINGFDNQKFQDITEAFRMQLEQFRADYSIHEVDLRHVIETDCRKHPDEFYEKLQTAQLSRIIVDKDIENMNKTMSVYKQAVIDFKSVYKKLESRE